jgi:two-component system response regulator NreC
MKILLDSVADFTVVAEADDLNAAMRYVTGRRPRVLVLDLALGTVDLQAATAIRQIRTELPETEVVVISDRESITAREAIGAGALGCVSTSAPATDLIEAVRRASGGEAYISAEILAAIVRNPRAPDGLSSREVETIGLIAMGYTSLEIGELLHVSVRTVESHRASLQLKLGRLTRAELVSYALEHGMTEAGAVVGAVNSYEQTSAKRAGLAPAG